MHACMYVSYAYAAYVPNHTYVDIINIYIYRERESIYIYTYN